MVVDSSLARCCRLPGQPTARATSLDQCRTTAVLTVRSNIELMSKLRPDELDDRLASGEYPFVLDIRPESNYRAGAIEGSSNVPVYDDLRSGDESTLRARLDEIPGDRDVVVVCKMGIVAKRATRLLDGEGYDAATLRGGMSGWRGYQNGSLSYKLRSLLWKLR